MSSDVLVQKYSQALFDACEAAKNTETVAAELAALVPMLMENSVQDFFNSPFNTADNKIMVAKSALEGQCSAELFNFLVTLAQNDRMAFVSDMNVSLQSLLRNKSGETEGVLFVAQDVSADFKSDVEKKLTETLHKKVRLTVQKDASLLSGFKVTVGGWTLDDSAQFHLNKIKEEILKRGI